MKIHIPLITYSHFKEEDKMANFERRNPRSQILSLLSQLSTRQPQWKLDQYKLTEHKELIEARVLTKHIWLLFQLHKWLRGLKGIERKNLHRSTKRFRRCLAHLIKNDWIHGPLVYLFSSVTLPTLKQIKIKELWFAVWGHTRIYFLSEKEGTQYKDNLFSLVDPWLKHFHNFHTWKLTNLLFHNSCFFECRIKH